jgi:type I restriction enzyme S subunit
MQIKLGSIVDIQSGYPFKSKDFSTYGIPVVKIKNIKNSKVVFDSNTSYVSNSILVKASNWKLLYGDILITMTGSNTAHPKSMVGDVAKVDSTAKMLLNQRVGRIKVIRPDIVDLDYIYYYAWC